MTQREADPDDARATEDQLTQSSQVLLTEVERLIELERRKIELPYGASERVMLASEIEDITIGLLSLGRYQTRLVRLEEQAAGNASGPPRDPNAILAEWRKAEARLHEARSAVERANDEVDRLRDEHRESMRRPPT